MAVGWLLYILLLSDQNSCERISLHILLINIIYIYKHNIVCTYTFIDYNSRTCGAADHRSACRIFFTSSSERFYQFPRNDDADRQNDISYIHYSIIHICIYIRAGVDRDNNNIIICSCRVKLLYVPIPTYDVCDAYAVDKRRCSEEKRFVFAPTSSSSTLCPSVEI